MCGRRLAEWGVRRVVEGRGIGCGGLEEYDEGRGGDWEGMGKEIVVGEGIVIVE